MPPPVQCLSKTFKERRTPWSSHLWAVLPPCWPTECTAACIPPGKKRLYQADTEMISRQSRNIGQTAQLQRPGLGRLGTQSWRWLSAAFSAWLETIEALVLSEISSQQAKVWRVAASCFPLFTNGRTPASHGKDTSHLLAAGCSSSQGTAQARKAKSGASSFRGNPASSTEHQTAGDGFPRWKALCARFSKSPTPPLCAHSLSFRLNTQLVACSIPHSSLM